MNNPEFELLVYLITSARALPEEPASYGSIRLAEAASRLCQNFYHPFLMPSPYLSRLQG